MYSILFYRDRLEETRGQNSSLSFTSAGLNSSPSSLSEVETDLSDLEDVRSPEDKADAIYESMKNVTSKIYNILSRNSYISEKLPLHFFLDSNILACSVDKLLYI